MSKLNFEEGLKYLSESDETLRRVISNLKPEKPDQREPNFESLIRIIAGQQLSSAAASTIFQRLKSRYTGQTITPEMIITTSSAEMLECGLSNPKVRYILQIAQGFQNQPNLIEDLKLMNSEQVLQTLQKFKGIGIWSASIFALFYLHHPDIFAWGDVSIKKAIKLLYEEQNLNEERTEEIIEPWRPYRSTACMVLWRWIDEGAIKFS